ncbi:MAG TPA: CBS domain-containing protein [Thermoanaerobaculia bacterium]|nr:CBS domain-containing protein [Thermoanaerobaculia bacterium]
MRVRDIMKGEVRLCGLDTDAGTAGRLMAEAGCGCLPVLAMNRVVGMITDRDICLALAKLDRKASEVQVREVITGELFTCGADDHIAEALETMRIFGFRRLPVVDDEQKLLGILSLDDLILESRALGAEGFDGPFHTDIARTLRGICSAVYETTFRNSASAIAA